MSESFYAVAGERVVASELTRGPWSPEFQHGGPVAGVLAHAIESAFGNETFQLARATLEIARPVPIAALAVSVKVLHRGRSVATVEAMASHEDKPMATMRALLVSTRSLDLPSRARTGLPTAIRLPDQCPPFRLPFELHPVGYHTAMDVRHARGAPGERVFVWMKMKVPLFEDETPSPLVRVMAAVDSTNGVSAVLDPSRFVYTNADLVVALSRMPNGEWIGLDALTHPEPNGVGLAEGEVFDELGPIGRVTQALVIAPRG